MSISERLDHWRASLDSVEALRDRMAEAPLAPDDPVARQLMAVVAHAKSSSFIALLDPSGHVLDINPAALIAGGVDHAEVTGLPLWSTAWWSADNPADAEKLQGAIVEAAAGRFSRFDVGVRVVGGEAGTLDMMVRPLRTRDGRVAFIVAEGRTITDRKRVEERLSRHNAELSALTERLARVHDYRERLLGELSHDLRAPLQVVIARSDQLLRSDPGQDVRSQAVNIRTAALGALEQINDMLEQVKADHGETQLAIMDADLASAVRTVAESFEPLAVDRGITLTVRTPDTLPARFDVERVSRIVSNLLANAIRHTPEGGTVSCAVAGEQSVARLIVADSGPGVPLAHRDRVFGRFRSGLHGDGRASGAGAGLGLAIVREFVELHGGEISLGEATQGGALFTVELPLRPPGATGVAASLAQHAAAAQRTEYVRSRLEAEFTGDLRPSVPTVVIVEPVQARADVIVQGIGEAAVTCVARDGEEALRVAGDLVPEAIVVGTAPTDMPTTSLLRRLASDARLDSMLRVALAGEREEDPGPNTLLTAGAHLVLPAGDADELGRRLFGTTSGLLRR